MTSLQRTLAAAASLALLVVSHAGCDDSSSESEDQSSKKGQALKLVIPPHKSTPKVELAFRVHPLEKSEVAQVKEPIGNAMYLALRACEEAHPGEGAVSVVPMTFDVKKGKVANVSKREPKVRGEAEPVGASGRECVFDELRGAEVEFSEGDFGKRELRVEAQAKLARTSP